MSSVQRLHPWDGIQRAGGWYFPDPKGRRSAGQQEDDGTRACNVIQTLSLCVISRFLFAHLLSLPPALSLLASPPCLIPLPQSRTRDCPGLLRMHSTVQTTLLSVPIPIRNSQIPSCKGCSFDGPAWVSCPIHCGQRSQPNGPEGLFSELGNPVKRVIIS